MLRYYQIPFCERRRKSRSMAEPDRAEPDRTAKAFPFQAGGLTCRHAIIRYRRSGQLDGNRERREHRQQGIGQPLRYVTPLGRARQVIKITQGFATEITKQVARGRSNVVLVLRG